MEQEMTGQIPVEQQLNRTSEQDPNSVVTLVYRGANPFMRSLANGLRQKGMLIDQREISPEDYHRFDEERTKLWKIENPFEYRTEEYQKFNAERADKLIRLQEGHLGTLSGIVVADGTMRGKLACEHILAYHAIEEEQISTYEDVVKKIGPVIDQLRHNKRYPVVLRNFLGEHYECGKLGNSQEISEKVKDELRGKEAPMRNYKQNFSFTYALKSAFNLPVIDLDSYCDSPYTKKVKNFAEVIRSFGIDSESAVILTDHHIYNMNYPRGKEDYLKSGVADLDIVPICHCCIGGDSEVQGALEDAGFKVYPLQYEGPKIAPVVEKLAEMIEQKKEELKH
jgi:hypothetical protein